MLPVIDGALAKETNKAAKAAFTEARAAILLFNSFPSRAAILLQGRRDRGEKLEAIAVVKARATRKRWRC